MDALAALVSSGMSLLRSRLWLPFFRAHTHTRARSKDTNFTILQERYSFFYVFCVFYCPAFFLARKSKENQIMEWKFLELDTHTRTHCILYR